MRINRSNCLSLCLVVLLSMFASFCQAHPIQFHLEPLDDATVARVATSLEAISRSLPGSIAADMDGAEGPAALVSVLVGALREADVDSTGIDQQLYTALLSAGYEESFYMVSEWQFEAERVLNAFEVLRDDLHQSSIMDALSSLDPPEDRLPNEAGDHQEPLLTRQLNLVHTTQFDQAAVSKQFDHLQRLVDSLIR